MTNGHTCLGCDDTWITYRFAICTKCEQVYGRRATQWPDWLRARWNMTQKERRSNRRNSINSVSFSELEAGLSGPG